jgi:hypothetical protein
MLVNANCVLAKAAPKRRLLHTLRALPYPTKHLAVGVDDEVLADVADKGREAGVDGKRDGVGADLPPISLEYVEACAWRMPLRRPTRASATAAKTAATTPLPKSLALSAYCSLSICTSRQYLLDARLDRGRRRGSGR